MMGGKNTFTDDAHLIKRALDGDKAAFNELWTRYQDYLVRVATRLSKSESAAKDIVQESCLRAYLGLRSLKNRTLFRSWLMGIVINVSREWIREKNNNLSSLDSLLSITGGLQLVETGDRPRLEEDPTSLFESKEVGRMLMESLMELPIRLRKSALLFYFDGLRLREATALLGVTENALKTRLSRARDSLRKKLRAKGVANV